MKVLVTGGLGFIGSAVVRKLITDTDHQVVNVDKVSYPSTAGGVEQVTASPNYSFHRIDLADGPAISGLVAEVRPDAVIHLAAESHVDRSIDCPRALLDSNVVGTFNLLEAVRPLERFHRFVHASTDEVFGSLETAGAKFDEATGYDPRSPYSATKAASDHLVRAWGRTYGLPISVTNCSNNYGSYQFPEKLIPSMIIKAWNGETLPVHGLGLNIRDWLHVSDHAEALLAVLERGRDGRTYAIGADSPLPNIEVIQMICELVNRAAGGAGPDRRSLIDFVADRPGHDLRYAVDSSRIRAELGWEPIRDFRTGLAETVDWYLANNGWWEPLLAAEDAGALLGLTGVSR